MALTINTAPNQQNNKAQWNVTTSLSEDASHVNLRVRATIYGPAGTLGIIEQPKGSADFDFTEMLYKFINYKTPALAPSGVFAQQLMPKTGANLITDWTNDAVHPLDGYTDQGDNSLLFIHHVGSYGDAHSNNFSVTKGKMYCLILKTGTINNTPGICNQAGAGEGTFLPDKLSMSVLPTLGRYILFALETGTTCLRFAVTTGWCEWTPAVFVELYELADCDWYLPYNVVWSEVYETALGVTTVSVGTTCLNKKTGQMLFKSPGITTFTDYICDGSAKKFLNPPLYLYPGTELSQRIMKMPPSGQSSHVVWIAVLPVAVTDVYATASYYAETGGYVDADNLVSAPSYQPIMALSLGNVAFTTTRFRARIKLMTTGSSIKSEYHEVYLINKVYPRLIELIWLNQYGGFTTLCLSDYLRETFVTDRTDYEVPSYQYVKRRASNVRKYWLVECEGQIFDVRAMDGIDLVASEYVMYSKVAGVFKEVYVREKDTVIIDNELINKLRTSFEYAD